MESKKAVRAFMLCILLGFAVYIPLVCIAFLIAERLSLAVFFGALYGSAVMTLYYYLFARATAKAVEADPETVKKRVQSAYSLRMFLLVIFMGAGVFLAVEFGIFHWLPLALSMLVPRATVAAYQALNRKKSKEGDEVGN